MVSTASSVVGASSIATRRAPKKLSHGRGVGDVLVLLFYGAEADLVGVFSMPRILHSNSLLHISPEGISVDAREGSGKLAGGKVLIAVIRPSGIEEYA